MKRIIIFLLSTMICFCLTAQNYRNHNKNDNSSNKNTTEKIDKKGCRYEAGFDFIIAGGCYFGSKYNAQYYNGDLKNENNLGYIFNNQYWRDEINRVIKDRYPYISDDVENLGPIGNTSYKVSVFVSLGVKYRFNDNWSLQLAYSFAHLIANGQFRLGYTAVPGTERTGMLDNQYIVGKEDRSMFDFSGCYLFTTHSLVRPFIELGAQFNFVRVKSMDAIFYDDNKNKILTYSLLNNLQNNIPGVQSDGRIVKYGGPGFGFSAAAGIKISFNSKISLDPTFYFSASKLGLPGYKDFSYNFGILIRVVMSDE